MALPTSWNLALLPTGPSRMNRNLVGMGTSVRSPSNTELASLTNAIIGLVRKSTSPTRTFEASAPGGIFFRNLLFP